MKRALLWGLAALLCMSLVILAILPASWLGVLLEQQTRGKLSLGDTQGSLWRGSAFLAAAASEKDPLAPLLPGRFSWRLSPSLLWGQVDLQLENPDVLAATVKIQGSPRQLQLGPGSLRLPADGLSSLGAPLNTIGLSGQISLEWSQLEISVEGQQLLLRGQTRLVMQDMASRLSFIKPLGAYQMQFDWQGQQADLNLKTVKGPLLLSGSGRLVQGRLQFSGRASADTGKEEMLANLLNLLGQRRTEGGKNIIALEYR